MKSSNFKKLGILVALIGMGFMANAQSAGRLAKIADKAYEDENYYTAAIIYQKLVSIYEGEAISTEGTLYPYQVDRADNTQQNFDMYREHMLRLANSYYNYAQYDMAAKWFGKYVTLSDKITPQTYFTYGLSLRADTQYDDAIKQFKKVESNIKVDSTLKANATYEILCCEFAIDATEHPEVVLFEKMDSTYINTEDASNYAAHQYLNENGDTVIMFTTTRFSYDNPDGSYRYLNELVTYQNEKISRDNIIEVADGSSLAASSLSGDGEFLYGVWWSEEPGFEKPHQIFRAVKQADGSWGEMEILGPDVNDETGMNIYPYVSTDGSRLFFSSNRQGGFGGYDIYMVPLDGEGLPNGRAINLGEQINSKGNERTPYWNPITETLYYSSDGLVGMGGLDIYKSSRENGTWTKAENMGYPYNSASDDAYPYFVDDSEDYGFLSSDRSKECCYELFKVEVGFYHAKGLVVEKGSTVPVPNAKLELKDGRGKLIDSLRTDSLGKYDFPLRTNQEYFITATLEGFLDGKTEYTTPAMVTVSDTVTLDTIEMIPLRVGQAVVLNNIFYDYDKATLRPESKYELNRLLEELLKHPELVVEIGSHTDSRGSDKYNEDLSQRRSESVVAYLVKNGLSQENILARGYGESQPIAPNDNADGSDNPEGRQLNRRTEFKVLGNNGRESAYFSETYSSQ